MTVTNSMHIDTNDPTPDVGLYGCNTHALPVQGGGLRRDETTQAAVDYNRGHHDHILQPERLPTDARPQATFFATWDNVQKDGPTRTSPLVASTRLPSHSECMSQARGT